MNLDKDVERKIEEIQILEQQLQGFLMEKQSAQVELNELTNAIEELTKTGDEVYKVVGSVMLKSTKEKLIKELEEKKKVFEIRLRAAEKQESLLSSKSEEMRKEIQDSLKGKKE